MVISHLQLKFTVKLRTYLYGISPFCNKYHSQIAEHIPVNTHKFLKNQITETQFLTHAVSLIN
jgi:hypothetical protein